ncbi:hypothetical protein C8R47DRAFT_751079 [Mycena vitilis]|nr:hypothetical protein C8R47DRAFT_751079 [Mycena vitilis]
MIQTLVALVQEERRVFAATISALHQDVRDLEMRAFMREREYAGELEKQRLAATAAILQLQAEAIRKKEVEIAERDIVEKYEAVDRCLQAYNTIVFDTQRKPGEGSRHVVLNEETKKLLEANDMGYIMRLFENHRSERPDNVKAARDQALRILSPEEQAICQVLTQEMWEIRSRRNALQHPDVDRATVLRRMHDIDLPCLPALAELLVSDPGASTDLRPFGRSETYRSVDQHRQELATLYGNRSATMMWFAQGSGRSFADLFS